MRCKIRERICNHKGAKIPSSLSLTLRHNPFHGLSVFILLLLSPSLTFSTAFSRARIEPDKTITFAGAFGATSSASFCVALRRNRQVAANREVQHLGDGRKKTRGGVLKAPPLKSPTWNRFWKIRRCAARQPNLARGARS